MEGAYHQSVVGISETVLCPPPPPQSKTIYSPPSWHFGKERRKRKEKPFLLFLLPSSHGLAPFPLISLLNHRLHLYSLPHAPPLLCFERPSKSPSSSSLSALPSSPSSSAHPRRGILCGRRRRRGLATSLPLRSSSSSSSSPSPPQLTLHYVRGGSGVDLLCPYRLLQWSEGARGGRRRILRCGVTTEAAASASCAFWPSRPSSSSSSASIQAVM